MVNNLEVWHNKISVSEIIYTLWENIVDRHDNQRHMARTNNISFLRICILGRIVSVKVSKRLIPENPLSLKEVTF